MNDFLQIIVAQKQAEVAAAARRVPVRVLEAQAADRRDHRSLAAALAPAGVRIIAEIKRASPSQGPIRLDLDPVRLARAYTAGGAAALSVLTEMAYFKGSIDDLQAARAATHLPVLRKDFILTAYQVIESAAIGADAILLIARLLSDEELSRLVALAQSLHLEALVEVHDARDAQRAGRLGARLIGINNRDLARLETDKENARRLAGAFSADMIVVAASGVATTADIGLHLAAGIRRFLIGETLVRSDDPAALLETFRQARPPGGRIEIKICGLTDPEQAAACAAAGADAIGFVFHPPSPRYVTPGRAREIAAALPDGTARVGVFVDDDAPTIRAIADSVGLTAVQLHGDSARATGMELLATGQHVVIVLRQADSLVDDARLLPPDAGVLVECGHGGLPGGNGAAWDWGRAAALAPMRPFAIAGGITPENVCAALVQARASAVDLSSGVESRPGCKDLALVTRLVAAVRELRPDWPASPVFSRKVVPA
jgi:indole-3-glycerol phosphate synthase/phosphoribosylanthranilate isomerase/anthranilate synthase/indole-3-glycerol phosphate synthase/phosphoribosylanthranilate isomerase